MEQPNRPGRGRALAGLLLLLAGLAVRPATAGEGAGATPPAPAGGMEALAAELVYPPEAKLAGVEGKVTATVTVDADGRVVECRGEGGADALVAEAVRALSAITWNPATEDGAPVRAEAVVPVIFRLSPKTETPTIL